MKVITIVKSLNKIKFINNVKDLTSIKDSLAINRGVNPDDLVVLKITSSNSSYGVYSGFELNELYTEVKLYTEVQRIDHTLTEIAWDKCPKEELKNHFSETELESISYNMTQKDSNKLKVVPTKIYNTTNEVKERVYTCRIEVELLN